MTSAIMSSSNNQNLKEDSIQTMWIGIQKDTRMYIFWGKKMVLVCYQIFKNTDDTIQDRIPQHKGEHLVLKTYLPQTHPHLPVKFSDHHYVHSHIFKQSSQRNICFTTTSFWQLFTYINCKNKKKQIFITKRLSLGFYLFLT